MPDRVCAEVYRVYILLLSTSSKGRNAILGTLAKENAVGYYCLTQLFDLAYIENPTEHATIPLPWYENDVNELARMCPSTRQKRKRKVDALDCQRCAVHHRGRCFAVMEKNS